MYWMHPPYQLVPNKPVYDNGPWSTSHTEKCPGPTNRMMLGRPYAAMAGPEDDIQLTNRLNGHQNKHAKHSEFTDEI
jgi:hypothetical protein